MGEQFNCILKSEEEDWMRKVHPKIRKKTVRIWIFSTPSRNSFYATIKMYDKGNMAGRTAIYPSIGEVLIEVYVTIFRVYGKRDN